MYCHACIGKMAIRCVWCASPILPGHRVTLYLTSPDTQVPEYAVPYVHPGMERVPWRSYVGCLTCARDGIIDAQGVWVPPGKVERIPSMTEVAVEAFRQGASMVVVKYH